jgi:hypothetical protein
MMNRARKCEGLGGKQKLLERKDVDMRYGSARNPRTIIATLLLAAAGLLVAGSVSAEPLQRLSAESQLNMPHE